MRLEPVENRDPTLCRRFIAAMKEILAGQHPELRHEWSIDDDEDHCWLIIPKLDEHGFDVVVEAWPEEIVVSGEGASAHLAGHAGIERCVRDATGLIRDLLSPGMRVIEFLSSGRVYRWAMEVNTVDGWTPEYESGKVFWNYFGRRSTRILQNDHLPTREELSQQRVVNP